MSELGRVEWGKCVKVVKGKRKESFEEEGLELLIWEIRKMVGGGGERA